MGLELPPMSWVLTAPSCFSEYPLLLTELPWFLVMTLPRFFLNVPLCDLSLQLDMARDLSNKTHTPNLQLMTQTEDLILMTTKIFLKYGPWTIGGSLKVYK